MGETNKELPPPRTGLFRFSDTTGDVLKWNACQVGFEVSGVFRGWRPSTTPGWNDLGVIEVNGATQVFPLVQALHVLKRLPPGSELTLIYVGKRASKRGGKSYHAFAIDFPNGVELLPDPDVANSFAPRELSPDQ